MNCLSEAKRNLALKLFQIGLLLICYTTNVTQAFILILNGFNTPRRMAIVPATFTYRARNAIHVGITCNIIYLMYGPAGNS